MFDQNEATGNVKCVCQINYRPADLYQILSCHKRSIQMFDLPLAQRLAMPVV